MTPGEEETGFQIYLRQIAKFPLLTAEQEVELAARIKLGDQQARADMVRANLKLVVRIARDYANFGLPLLDLISEGNIGLMKAVERFDPAKGGKLSTYAACGSRSRFAALWPTRERPFACQCTSSIKSERFGEFLPA